MAPTAPAVILGPAPWHLDPSVDGEGVATCNPAPSSPLELSAGPQREPVTLQNIAQESHLDVQRIVTMKMAWSAMEQEVIVTKVVADLDQNDAIFFGVQQRCQLLQHALLLQTVAAKRCFAQPSIHLDFTLG